MLVKITRKESFAEWQQLTKETSALNKIPESL
jgi:hypothetical protein